MKHYTFEAMSYGLTSVITCTVTVMASCEFAARQKVKRMVPDAVSINRIGA